MGTFDEITQQMILAITGEIEAVKEKGGGQNLLVSDGRLVGSSAGRFLYEFMMDSELAVPSDTPGQLQVGDQRYDVTVVGMQEFKLTLALAVDLGPTIPSGRLSFAPYFILEKLRDRLSEFMSNQLPANRALALDSISPAPHCKAQTQLPTHSASEFARDGLNQEQAAAIDQCLRGRVSFLWGPPGTGKTTTIGQLATELVSLGRRVLVTSHTNIAVDTAIEKVMKKIGQESLDTGVVVRMGTPQLSEVDYVTLEAIVQRKSVPLTQERLTVENQIAHTQSVIDRYLKLQEVVAKLAELEREASLAENRVTTLDRKVTELERGRNQVADMVSEQERRLADAESAGFLRRLVAGLNPAAIRSRINELKSEQAQSERDIASTRKITGDARVTAETVKHQFEEYRRSLSRYGEIPSDLPSILTREKGKVAALRDRINEIDRKLKEIEASVLDEAKLIGATLSKLAISDLLHKRKYDIVIIDEASMVSLPSVWLGACLAADQIIIAGDFRQLAPIAMSDGPLADSWLKRDAFAASGVSADIARNQKSGRLSALRRQYRMHPVIGDLTNRLAYEENPLMHNTTPETLAPGLKAAPESGFPLVLCDTSGANPWCARLQPGYSRYNIYSAIASARLAIASRLSGAGIRVGIVTPYRAQANLIRAMLGELGNHDRNDDSVVVSTVHRFQGNERDVIVFDLVDGPPYAIGTLLKSTDDSRRLINVAVSRAKGKLVVVSHHAHLTDKARKDSPLWTLMDYAANNGRYLDAKTIVEGHSGDAYETALRAVSRSPEPIKIPDQLLYYDETDFYAQFQQDLLSARERAVILSPFLQANRTAKLMPILRSLVERGIQITLLIRRADRQDEGVKELIEEIRRVGITIIERPNLHEKLAFIDSRIAWFGSLNILSQSRSTETMLRFAESGIAKQLMELTGTTSLIQAEKKRSDKASLLETLTPEILRRMSVPTCTACGRQMELRPGQYGPFFGCPAYRQHEDRPCIMNIPRPVLKAAVEALDLKCPECEDGRLVLKHSKRGGFLGCDRYPECRSTRSI
ncbi:MAG: AAA domain-containing protein [Bacillota bacterium]|nr:AAA domain-containing protein [Bacillota bacterium]